MSLPEIRSACLHAIPLSRVELVATTRLPTRHGDFKLLAFRNPRSQQEYATLVKGEPRGHRDVILRLHSECLTGDVFGSLRCDCGPQLAASLEIIGQADRGVLIYLPQEGRGIGLANKIRAYALQDRGMDTVEANHALGFPNDLRDYHDAADILRLLGVESVAVLTNNPEKIEQLSGFGIEVSRRLPLVEGENPCNARYLSTKKEKCGHLL
jgi:GTP cyclohydrolase II